MALLDAVVRLLPGVMGNDQSATSESFAEALLEYPHYTRPQIWEGRAIPDVLISGDHARIAAWRRAEAERLTRQRRPDLLKGRKERTTRRYACPRRDKPACRVLDNPGRLGYGTAQFQRIRRWTVACAIGALASRRDPVKKGLTPMNIIQELEKEQAAAIMGGKTIPEFAPGDTVKVNVKVTEGTRTRIQAYEGVCIAPRRRRPQRKLHRAEDFLRRGRRARVPDLLAVDRFDRSRAPRQGAPREALLSPRPPRQVGAHLREAGFPRRGHGRRQTADALRQDLGRPPGRGRRRTAPRSSISTATSSTR